MSREDVACGNIFNDFSMCNEICSLIIMITQNNNDRNNDDVDDSDDLKSLKTHSLCINSNRTC